MPATHHRTDRSTGRTPLAALLALLVVTASTAFAQGGPPTAQVRAARAVMRPIDPRAETTGRVRAWRVSALAAREPGRILQIDIRPGDEVAEGQVIAQLDDMILRAEVAAGEAALSSAAALVSERDAQLARAERDLARLSDLVERQSASENELLDARTTTDAARARRDQAMADQQRAEATLALLRQRLDDMTIRAPFAGRVIARAMEAGQWADRGDAILELAQIDPIEVWIDVPERYIHPMQQSGSSVVVTARAIEARFESTEIDIVPQGVEAARTFPVRLRLENPEKQLLPGMSVTASVPTGRVEPRLLVPSDAMLRDDAGWFVYTATGETEALMALPARVEPITIVDGMTAVRVIGGPLYPGAMVVIEGNERIMFPGQPLAVTNAADLGDAPAPQGAPDAPSASRGDAEDVSQ